MRAGLKVSAKSVSELMKALDESGDETLDFVELEAALRAHRRGKEIWDIRAEQAEAQKMQQGKPQASTPKGAAGSGTQQKKKNIQSPKQQLEAQGAKGDEEIDPASLLDKIQALLKQRQLRVVDLFRHPTYNPSYLKTKDENLDADEVAQVFMRAGLKVSAKSVSELMKALDESGDETLDFVELEAALRAHRRGKEIWDIRAEQAEAQKKAEEEDAPKKTNSEKKVVRVRPKKMASAKTDDDDDPNNLLDKIQEFLEEKDFRVVDLFRHPQFNPSYLKTRDDNLDVDEIANVFMRAGLKVNAAACNKLMRLLDHSGDKTLDFAEFEAALRARRRGKDLWEIKAEKDEADAKKKTKSTLSWQRKVMTEVDASEPPWAGRTLQALEKMMDEKDLRISDLFRHPHYNPSYLEHGDESMTATEMQLILKKAGCELPLKDVRKMIDCIDLDDNGMIDIDDMERAMRLFRRGEMEWTPKAKKEKRPVNMEHITKMHNSHVEKLKRNEEMLESRHQQEDEAIQQEIEEARVGTRGNIQQHEWDGKACAKRLYDERKEMELKHVALVQKVEAERQEKVDSARLLPVRSASDPALAERLDGFKHIGHRLHAVQAARDDERRRIKMQVEAQTMAECDKINQNLIARGGVVGDRHHQLFEEAADRASRRNKKKWENLEKDQMSRSEHSVAQHRQALTDLSRLHDLHAENQHRLNKTSEEAIKKAELNTDLIRQSAEKGRCNTKNAYRDVSSRHKEMHPFQEHPGSKELRDSRQMKTDHPLGFGNRGGRHSLLAKDKSRSCIESVDHVLSAVNQIVATRANCTPEESQLNALRDLMEPLSALMQEYKDAARDAELSGEGAEWLRNAQCMRLFHDGCLMEDLDGWHECTQPDTLMQTVDDFDVLMELAAKAQAQLLLKVGPEGGEGDADKIGKRWPMGAKWNHPRATKKAQFAYNPGIKPRGSAVAKAFVRFGPSERENRYRHLLDLARCGLVFADGAMLREGLNQIIDRFEVIQVLNYYNKDHQNLLGQKHIEVLIVLKCPEPFICELRLEEMSYFIAREKASPHIEKIQKTMANLYSGNGADPLAIEYLASWILHRPKENHSVTVFKKHLSRRFGSTVAAWRKAMGGGNQAPFTKFREACQDVNMRHRTVEFFQSLDATFAGNFSLFELDPEAAVLLVKFYWRICGLATPEQLEDSERLFARLTRKTVVKLKHPGRMEAHEFRRVAKVLGFEDADSDRVFQFLDSHGGEAHEPPATLTPNDIAWLKKIPQILCVECVMLRDSTATSEMESLRAINMSGRAQQNQGRRARMPHEVSRAGSRSSSLSGAIRSKPNIVVKRASSVGGSASGSRPQSARNSISSKQSGTSQRPQTAPMRSANQPVAKGSGQRTSVGTVDTGAASQATTAAPVGATAWGDDSDGGSAGQTKPSAAMTRPRSNSLGEESSDADSDVF